MWLQVGLSPSCLNKAMLANPDIGVTQIAHRLGVSPATLYRYIPAAQTRDVAKVFNVSISTISRLADAR
jgi:DNA-binding MurR/RpiR family transcriptional regulator